MTKGLLSLAEWTIMTLGFLCVGGTLLSLSRSPHPLVRAWDFPRVQVGSGAILACILYATFFFEGDALGWFFLGTTGATSCWQLYRILPYTPIGRRLVEDSRGGHPRIRLVTSNVLQDNDCFDLWLEVIGREDPDLILALETDRRWERALKVLESDYPYGARDVRENKYGMMLFSRLPLEETHVRHVVENSIPSIHTRVLLPSGPKIAFHGLHPRPPQPSRNQDSKPRDAELVVVGREVREEKEPVVVAGDLNDVAWSCTTELFVKVSGLLDPRRGRGFYNTFPADLPFLRYPLDHVFHSDTFRLVELRRLERVGSDHFPVLIELSCEPAAQEEQPQPEPEPEEREAAQDKVEREERVEDARDGRDAGLGQRNTG